MKCLALFTAALALICVCCGAAENAQDEVEISVTTEGVAAVVGGDLGKAEDEALADAKRNAVEQALGVFVKAESLGENYEMVKETILTKSEGYISQWGKVEGSRKVENFEGNQLLKIKIWAKVKLVGLINDLSGIEEVYKAVQRPRMMVLIAEENLGKPNNDFPASSSAVIRSLQDRKFEVVDQATVEKINLKESARAMLELGDSKAAGLLALNEGAEILILGKASSSKSKLPADIAGEVEACSATLTARIVYTATGEILFTSKLVEGRAVGFNSPEDAGMKALDDAGNKLMSGDAKRFESQVLAGWAKEVQNGRILRLTANDVSYEQYIALKKVVSDFRGFVELVREGDYQAKKGVLDIRIKLTPSEFRERLLGASVAGKKPEITQAFGSLTSITLK